MKDIIYDCIVIGGGASGLFFSASLAGTGLPSPVGTGHPSSKGVGRYLMLEKTKSVGTKLLMSGGGHCNITHEGSIKDFIPCYGNAGKKIRRVLYRHNNLELMDYLKSNGVPTEADEDGRVFPKSRKASQVLDLLLSKTKANGFTIQTNTEVVGINTPSATGTNPQSADDEYGINTNSDASDSVNRFDCWQVRCINSSSSSNSSGRTKSAHNEIVYYAKNIVIATGGCSYPTTGSDGSIFPILERDLGLRITELKPALCPIKVENYPFVDLAGISLNAEIRSGAVKSFGSLLFTHDGFSGPAAINISGRLAQGDTITINFLGSEQGKHRVINYEAAFDELQKATVGSKSSLHSIIAKTFNLPKRFAEIVANESGGSTKKAAQLLCRREFVVSNSGSFKDAMVTAGGIDLEEVDLGTMELKAHPGIYVIGEALDVDGITGGYNLQFTYSSAKAAADSILLK